MSLKAKAVMGVRTPRPHFAQIRVAMANRTRLVAKIPEKPANAR
jgi:hypothetical protein